MHVACASGGPASPCFADALKKRQPTWEAEAIHNFWGYDSIDSGDGLNSVTRSAIRRWTSPSGNEGKNKYAWFSVVREFAGFIFAFIKAAEGWLWAHIHPYAKDASTFIVECSQSIWRALWNSNRRRACGRYRALAALLRPTGNAVAAAVRIGRNTATKTLIKGVQAAADLVAAASSIAQRPVSSMQFFERCSDLRHELEIPLMCICGGISLDEIRSRVAARRIDLACVGAVIPSPVSLTTKHAV